SALIDEAHARRNGLILDFDHRQAFVECRFFTTTITEHAARVRRDDDLPGMVDIAPASVITQDCAGDLHVSQPFMELFGPWKRWFDDNSSGRVNVPPASIPLESRKSLGKLSDGVKTEGDYNLAGRVNEPCASMLIDFEESLGVR